MSSIDIETATSEELREEAAAWRLVANLLRVMPDKEWLAGFAGAGIFEEPCPFAPEQPAVAEGMAQLAGWCAAFGEDSFDDAYNDYMNLFVGPFKPKASPWESVWSPEHEGLVFQEETLEARKAYLTFGLEIDNLHHDPDDHICYETEFMAVLCEKAADALDAGDSAEKDRCMVAKASFMRQHLSTWGPQWADKVCENGNTALFRGVALLVKGFIAQYAA